MLNLPGGNEREDTADILNSMSVSSNQTIDDADALVQYSRFSSTPPAQSTVPDLQGGYYYMNTISYTSSAQASASLSFTGKYPTLTDLSTYCAVREKLTTGQDPRYTSTDRQDPHSTVSKSP